MSANVSINLSQLQEAVEHVQKTQRAQSVRLAEGVVAVVQPEAQPAVRRSGRTGRHAPAARHTGAKTYTHESAYGAVADTGGPRDVDQMIRAAQAEQAIRSYPAGIIAATAGRVKTDQPARSAEELRVLAEEAIAADVRERS